MRQGAWSRQNIKTSFPNRCSGIFLVESIEGWSKKQDKTSKQTSDHKTKINQNGRSKRSLHESQGEPRGERDVIRLRNPTEDKRAFRRMLTSADLSGRWRQVTDGKTCAISTKHNFGLPVDGSFSSPEPVVSWSRGRLQIKPSGSGDENGWRSWLKKTPGA